MIIDMIHLFKEYYLKKHDRYNYAICKRSVNGNTGAETFRPIGFYTNTYEILTGVKRLYVKEQLISSIENNDVEKLIEQLQLVHNEVVRQIGNVDLKRER